jgi:hypothetical protein
MLKPGTLYIMALAVFLFACEPSNPALGTWKISNVEMQVPKEVAENPLAKDFLKESHDALMRAFDGATCIYTEKNVTMRIKDGNEKVVDVQYKKTEDGKNWMCSYDGGKTFLLLTFKGDDEMSYVEDYAEGNLVFTLTRVKK